MEITTKPTIQEEVEQQALGELIGFAEKLEAAGIDRKTIIDKVNLAVQARVNAFYQKKNQDVYQIRETLEGLKLRQKTNESKAESVFYHLLKDNNINFKFQVEIGSYRVDYLIEDSLIFEGDGPQHKKNKAYDQRRDEYLEGLGYTVMRYEWKLVVMMPDVIISTIKRVIDEQNARGDHWCK